MLERQIGYKNNKDLISEYLKDVKKIFDMNNITFFLFFGTLLGAIRDNDFISYDNDVDIAIFGRDVDKTILLDRQFSEMGYRVCTGNRLISSNRRSNYYIMKPEQNKYIKIDIHTLFLFRNARWYVKRCIENNNIYECAIPYPKKFFITLEQINFNEDKYNVPRNSIGLLNYSWGIDLWKIKNEHGQYGNDMLALHFLPGEFKDEENGEKI